MKKIRKAVFPVSGFGENVLAATKAVPVEMFPVLDRPLIQYAVDEARSAGIEEFIFVTGRNGEVIKKHFDFDARPNDAVKRTATFQSGLAMTPELPASLKATFVRQRIFRGVGQDILCARERVGDEPFAVLVPTMLISAKVACIQQLLKHYQKTGGAVLALEESLPRPASRHGFIEFSSLFIDRTKEAGGKDQFISDAHPSNLALAGRYIFPPSIFQILEDQKKELNSQTQLTEAIGELAGTTPVSGHRFEGTTFDCGSQTGRVVASMFFALDHEVISQELVEELVRTKLHSRIGKLLDASALTKLATTLQMAADQSRQKI